jgi:hypothetical protein
MICLTSLTVPDSLPVDPCGAGDPEGLSSYQVTAVCTAHLLDMLKQVHNFLLRNTFNHSHRFESTTWHKAIKENAATGAWLTTSLACLTKIWRTTKSIYSRHPVTCDVK